MAIVMVHRGLLRASTAQKPMIPDGETGAVALVARVARGCAVQTTGAVKTQASRILSIATGWIDG